MANENRTERFPLAFPAGLSFRGEVLHVTADGDSRLSAGRNRRSSDDLADAGMDTSLRASTTVRKGANSLSTYTSDMALLLISAGSQAPFATISPMARYPRVARVVDEMSCMATAVRPPEGLSETMFG
ncbi:hypothetical protein ACFWMU_36600 [Streptomyces sp. NPDC058357]|uniref:hypothetical protein n=1 Tax=unclassified Streptomyces TaxID=2593676 RepID=UPI003659C83F